MIILVSSLSILLVLHFILCLKKERSSMSPVKCSKKILKTAEMLGVTCTAHELTFMENAVLDVLATTTPILSPLM